MSPKPEPVELRNGEKVWVRPVRSDDAGELQRTVAMMSDHSRYQRFLSGTPSLSDKLADYFSDVDHVLHEALVALPAPGADEIVGVARFVRDPREPSDADLALTVVDSWHGRGLGTALLRLLSRRAHDVGVLRFTVDMLADNAAVIALVRSAGGTDLPTGAGVVTGHIPVTDPPRVDVQEVLLSSGGGVILPGSRAG